MAIQKINDALPNGDTPRKINEKINENFSNTEHAASRLVGTGASNLVEARDIHKATYSYTTLDSPSASHPDIDTQPMGEVWTRSYIGTSMYTIVNMKMHHAASDIYTSQIAYGYGNSSLKIRSKAGEVWKDWATFYSTENTKKDSRTNLLLASDDSIPSTSAASRLVGTNNGNVPEIREIGGVAGSGMGGKGSTINTTGMKTDEEVLSKLFREIQSKCYSVTDKFPGVAPYSSNLFLTTGPSFSNISIPHTSNNVFIHSGYTNVSSGTLNITTRKLWHDKNTKLDTNGALAPSSPTIDLYSDHIETNDDGAKMNPEFIRNGVGDYTIKNTTGLRDEGWYIKIPNDMNGNPKVAVAIDTDKEGNLSIKTYKRTFSMETFTFGPDLSEPLDIPEGRWIDLRFNDLPEEELYEPELEEEPLVDEEEEPEVVEEEETVVNEPEASEEEPEEEEEVPVVEEPKD